MKLLQFLKANRHDIIVATLSVLVTILAIHFAVRSQGIVADVLLPLVLGFAKCAFMLLAGWVLLKVTFSEFADFLFGEEFDNWWAGATPHTRAITSLCGAAIVMLVISQCLK